MFGKTPHINSLRSSIPKLKTLMRQFSFKVRVGKTLFGKILHFEDNEGSNHLSLSIVRRWITNCYPYHFMEMKAILVSLKSARGNNIF